MMENREFTMDDYLAMLRRRMKVILIPALLAPLAGFLVSYAFPSKYTSQSLVLVEGQKVPEGMVQPVVTADLTAAHRHLAAAGAEPEPSPAHAGAFRVGQAGSKCRRHHR